MTATLIWLNGPFGGGKTQTAFELASRMPNAFVLDPEQIGYTLRRLTPRDEWLDDFQHLPQWRDAVRRHLLHVATHSQRVILIPMTLVDANYFAEIVGGMRNEGVPLHHFSLMAPRDVVLARLRQRGDGAKSWPARQLDRCLEALQSDAFAQHVDTGSNSIEEVAEHIAECVGLTLLQRRPVWTRRLSRLQVWFRHARLPWQGGA